MAFVLGIDIGHSALKLAYGEDTEMLPARTITLPAIASPADDGALVPMHQSPHDDGPCSVSIDGQTWIAGVPWRSLRLPRRGRQMSYNFPETEDYRALLYAGLQKAGTNVIDRLVTSVPAFGHLKPEGVAPLKARLEGVHLVAPGQSVEVREASIWPHAVGTFMHLRQPLRRSWNCDSARVLVIDAGYFSIDWAVITNGRNIRNGTIGNSVWALNYVCGFVREAVLRDYRIMLDDDEIEKVLGSGPSVIRLQDHLVDLAPYLASALDRVIDAALIEIRAMWCRLEEGEPELLALAGGGAKHFKDQIARAFPRVKLIVPEQPLVSNVVGLWHIGAERLISSRMARRYR